MLVLHVGYLWLCLGLLLSGLAILPLGVVPAASGLHALTAGAFGVMTLAVMTRASLGHTGQPLTATPRISAIYWLVNLVERKLEVFRSPHPDAEPPNYGDRTEYGIDESVPLLLDGVVAGTIAVVDLLP